MHVQPSEALPKIMFARYYGSNLGRFLRPDPKPASARAVLVQSWNRYPYALNNPIRYVDPDGRDIYDTTGHPVIGQVAGDLTAIPAVQSTYGPGSGRDLTIKTGHVQGDSVVGLTIHNKETGNTWVTIDLANIEGDWKELGASSALNLLIRTLGHELAHAVLEALGLEHNEEGAEHAAKHLRKQRVETFDPEPDEGSGGQDEGKEEPEEDKEETTSDGPASYGIDPDGPYGPTPHPCQGRGPMCR